MNFAEEAAKFADGILLNSYRKSCALSSYNIFELARTDSTDAQLKKYLEVIGKAFSYYLKPEDTRNPFVSSFMDKSITPDNFTNQEISFLEEVAVYFSNNISQARVNDILWLKLRKPVFAERAIQHYVDSAMEIFTLESWIESRDFIQRALGLASIFRRKNPALCENVANVLLKWVMEYRESETGFFIARAIDLLLQFGYGNPKELYDIAKALAKKGEAFQDYFKVQGYWESAIKCAQESGDLEDLYLAQKGLADSFANLSRSPGTSALSASGWMQQSIEIYKKVPNSKEVRESLYEELLAFQKASISEMQRFEYPLNVSELINNTISLFEGKNLRESLYLFAFRLVEPPNYSTLKEQAKRLSENSISHLFSSTYVDSEGKVVAHSSKNEANRVSESDLYKVVSLQHQIIVTGQLLPAIDIITMNHKLTERDFLTLASDNPFVSFGQEIIYAKGLYAGFNKDFIVSASLLVPLLENSIRHVLKSVGVRVSTLNTYGVQEELRLNALLEHEKSIELFGPDIIEDLRGLLIAKTYSNLRNKVSHGLLRSKEFFSFPTIYLWWLILRLCLTPHFELLNPENDTIPEVEI